MRISAAGKRNGAGLNPSPGVFLHPDGYWVAWGIGEGELAVGVKSGNRYAVSCHAHGPSLTEFQDIFSGLDGRRKLQGAE